MLFDPFDGADQLLDDVRASLVPTAKRGGLIPAVDVYEADGMIVVEAPLAGVDPKNIELSVDQGVLAIKAISERRTEVDEKTYYRKEVRHGALFRQIPLPAPVQEDKAEAKYEQGVLTVRLPKRTETGTAIPVKLTSN